MTWSWNPFENIGNLFESGVNLISGNGFNTNKEIADLKKAEKNKLINFNAGFEDLFDSGGSSDDLLKYLLNDTEGINYDKDLFNTLINKRMSDEALARNDYEINLSKMKEAGINPLVGMGSVGSLGDGVGYASDIGSNVARARGGSSDYNADLGNIKNILLILLALGRLGALA